MTRTTFGGLRADGLALSRGERRLFAGLSFALAGGEVLRLLGANGSGKSSLLRALIGLAPLSAGALSLGALSPGAPDRSLRPRELCAAALYQGHASGAKAELTAHENLALSAALDGTIAAGAPGGAYTALHGALERVGLDRSRDVEARSLSQGQRQRLALARFALALDHDGRPLWLMDEPSAALDADGAALLAALLREHLGRGGAAIVATHLPVEPEGARVRELRLEAFAPRRARHAATTDADANVNRSAR